MQARNKRRRKRDLYSKVEQYPTKRTPSAGGDGDVAEAAGGCDEEREARFVLRRNWNA
jgi:hypothetical protein